MLTHYQGNNSPSNKLSMLTHYQQIKVITVHVTSCLHLNTQAT